MRGVGAARTGGSRPVHRAPEQPTAPEPAPLPPLPRSTGGPRARRAPPAGLPLGPWSLDAPPPEVRETMAGLAALPQAGAPADVKAAFAPYADQVTNVSPRDDLPAALNMAGGRYVIGGVPKLINALLSGNADDAQAPAYVWLMLGGDAPACTKMLTDLIDFTLSSTIEGEKIVFSATAHTYAEGDEVGALLSTTESPEMAAKYLPHPDEARRVVAFVLEGTEDRPARAGVLKNDTWNELVLPPDLYRVRKVEHTAFGEVVRLEPKTGELNRLRAHAAARIAERVPLHIL